MSIDVIRKGNGYWCSKWKSRNVVITFHYSLNHHVNYGWSDCNRHVSPFKEEDQRISKKEHTRIPNSKTISTRCSIAGEKGHGITKPCYCGLTSHHWLSVLFPTSMVWNPCIASASSQHLHIHVTMLADIQRNATLGTGSNSHWDFPVTMWKRHHSWHYKLDSS